MQNTSEVGNNMVSPFDAHSADTAEHSFLAEISEVFKVLFSVIKKNQSINCHICVFQFLFFSFYIAGLGNFGFC